jgi:hypothetical protein
MYISIYTVTVRKEDAALKPFVIPYGPCSGTLLEIKSVSVHLGDYGCLCKCICICIYIYIYVHICICMFLDVW